MKTINWDCSKEDMILIDKIVKRACTPPFHATKSFELSMDITACHLNGNPLDLQKLLDFDDSNFAHDVAGISNHIDRKTGELVDCFVPRCSKN